MPVFNADELSLAPSKEESNVISFYPEELDQVEVDIEEPTITAVDAESGENIPVRKNRRKMSTVVKEPTMVKEGKKLFDYVYTSVEEVASDVDKAAQGDYIGEGLKLAKNTVAKAVAGATTLGSDIVALGLAGLAEASGPDSDSLVEFKLRTQGYDKSVIDAVIADDINALPEGTPQEIIDLINRRQEQRQRSSEYTTLSESFSDASKTISETIQKDIFNVKENEGEDIVTDFLTLGFGGAAGIKAGKKKLLKKIEEEGVSIPTDLNTPLKGFAKSIESRGVIGTSVDLAKGEVIVSGQVTFGSEEDEGASDIIDTRVTLPLASMLISTALGGVAIGTKKLSKEVSDYITDIANIYSVPDKAQIPPYSLYSKKAEDDILKAFFEKNFIETDSGEFKSRYGSMIGTRTAISEQFAFLDAITRYEMNYHKGVSGSRDTLETASYVSSKLMREDKQGLAHTIISGDEGVGYFDRYGVLKNNHSVKSLKQIYADAKNNGGDVDGISLFETAQDALDNYLNIENITKEKFQSLFTFIDESDLYDNFYLKNSQKLDDIFFNILDPDKGLISGGNSTKTASQLYDEFELVVDTLASADTKKLLKDKFNSILDIASRKPVLTKDFAQSVVDEGLKTPWGPQLQQDLSKLNSHFLDMLVDSGHISVERANLLRKMHPNYLPNFKTEEFLSFAEQTSKSATKPKTVKDISKRKISEKEQRNPIASRVEYIMTMSNAIAESRVRKDIFNWMQRWEPNDYQYFTFASKDKVEKAIASIRAGKKTNFTADELLDSKYVNDKVVQHHPTLTFNIDGGTIELPIRNRQLYELIKNSGNLPLDGVSKHLFGAWNGANRLIRNLIVYSPDFVIKTFGQELHDKLVNSNAKLKDRLDLRSTIGALFNTKGVNEGAFRIMNNNSGFYGTQAFFENRLDDKKLTEYFLREVEGAKSIGSKFIEAADNLLRRADYAPRIAYYKQLRNMGYKEHEALLLAKDLGVRFTQRGTATGGFAQTVYSLPFMRTTVNSVDRLGRRVFFENKKYRNGVAVSGLTTWIMSKALENPEADVPENIKRRKLVVGGSESEAAFGIDYGFVTPSYPMHNTLDYVYQGLDQVMDGVITNSINVLDPELGKAFKRADPSGKKVVLEWATWAVDTLPKFSIPGYDVLRTLQSGETRTGTPLMSEELKDKSPMHQYTERTSPSLVKLSQWLYDNAGYEISPIKLEYAFTSLLPNVSDISLQLSDHTFSYLGILPEQPRIKKSEVPVVSRFIIEPDYRGTSQTFYNLHAEAVKAVNQVRSFEGEADKDPEKLEHYMRVLDENRDFLEMYEITSDAQKNIRELKEIKKAIRFDQTPDWKSDRDREFFGSLPKREALHQIDVNIKNIMSNSIQQIKQLSYGEELLDTYSTSYSRTVEDLMGVLGGRKIEKGAKYDKSFDEFFNNTSSDTGLIEVQPLSSTITIEAVPYTTQDMIVEAAEEIGINPNAALVIAQLESKLGTQTENPASNATGVYQIMPKTWNNLIAQGFGEEFGITKADINDPQSNIYMGLLLMRDNYQRASATLKRDLNIVEVYSLHLLGLSDGLDFIEAKDKNQYRRPVKEVISTNAYKSNPNLFKDKTIGDVLALLTNKINEADGQLNTEEGA